MTAVVVLIVLLLLAASTITIFKFDRPRLWDHIARSFVQMAIAIATVFVALTLFDRQLGERDKQVLEQQRLVVSAYIRSKIFETLAIYQQRRKPLVENRRLECNSICEANPAMRTAYLRTAVSIVADSPEVSSYYVPNDYAEVWQLIRSAPLVDQYYVDQLLAIYTEHNRTRIWSGSIMNAVSNYNTEAAKTADRNPPLAALEQAFSQMSGAQIQAIKALIKEVCQLQRLLDAVTTGTKVPKFDDTQNEYQCAHSPIFSDFMAAADARPKPAMP